MFSVWCFRVYVGFWAWCFRASCFAGWVLSDLVFAVCGFGVACVFGFVVSVFLIFWLGIFRLTVFGFGVFGLGVFGIGVFV